MKSISRMIWLSGLLLLAYSSPAQTETISLWDGPPPLAVANPKPESELPLEKGMEADIVRLGNVSVPSMTVYHPPTDKRNGTCVLICPGGGYYILANKHEGSQVAEWLNSLGVTAVVLKYRVPAPHGELVHARPLLDGQRAMSLIRSHAREWGLATNRIGVLGFSAGGHLAAWLLCQGNQRGESYPSIANEPPCRPDFGVLIYPAYLNDTNRLRPPPAIRSQEKPGPVFLAHADDDKLSSENSVEFYLVLKRAGIPSELHIYQQGGHGFGMLPRGGPVHDWPRRCAEWMRATGIIPPAL